jgi:hypothetical protein
MGYKCKDCGEVLPSGYSAMDHACGWTPKKSDPYDPRLKVVAEEIKAVLKRHNMAGLAVLSSDTHGEWATHFPTWAGLGFTEDGDVRVRINSAEPDKAAATIHLLVHLRDLLVYNAEAMHHIFETTRKEYEAQGGEITMAPEGRWTPG